MKKLLIAICLLALMYLGFTVRLDNFKNSRARTIDEVVYSRMGTQMSRNYFDYNTIPYGQELAGRGRPLPKYFFQPLFKHPPLFTLSLTAVMKLFGKKVERTIEKNRARIEKYEELALFFFVAIPAPFTGSYTGVLVASVMDMNKRKATLVISLGVIISAIIMFLSVTGAIHVFNGVT